MIVLDHLSKTFNGTDGSVEALKDVSLKINDSDIYGIIGMSGAGKSTLVRCINLIEKPTQGKVLIDGVDITGLSGRELRDMRKKVSMIFQGFNLLMQRTCLKNICFPMELVGTPKSEARKRANDLLELVGLSDKANSYPSQLSGGQQQRIAIARALASNPKVLLCDEATSALDPNTTHSILQLIKKINEDLGITVIVITHQMSVVEEICNRVAILDDGVVVEEGTVSEVFSSPKSQASRKLVFPNDSYDSLIESDGSRQLRVVFNGAPAAGEPIVAKLAVDEGILASIVFATVKKMSGKIYGSLMLSVSGDDNTVERAISFFNRNEGINAMEVIKND